jgi:septum site-determining protein MinD
MAGYVCTIASGKGGAGKTTTAVNLGAVFGDEGYDVAVVDADLGMANVGEMLGLECDRGIHDVLAGDATVDEAAVETDGIAAVPGDRALEAFAEADPAELRTVIDPLSEGNDLVLVDTSTGLSHETAVPLGLADGVLLVTTPEAVSLLDTGKTAELVERVDGEVVGSLFTRVTSAGDIGGLDERFGAPTLGVVPANRDAAGEPVVHTAPESDVAAAYRALVDPLSVIFFEDTGGPDVEPAFDRGWFGVSADDGLETAVEADGEDGEDGEAAGDDSEDPESTEDSEDDDGNSSIGWGGLFTG